MRRIGFRRTRESERAPSGSELGSCGEKPRSENRLTASLQTILDAQVENLRPALAFHEQQESNPRKPGAIVRAGQPCGEALAEILAESIG